MEQRDINNILDTLGVEWAQDLANAKRKIAILIEENRVLKEENEKLKTALDKKAEPNKEKGKEGENNVKK